jgi:hypothetical protein
MGYNPTIMIKRNLPFIIILLLNLVLISYILAFKLIIKSTSKDIGNNNALEMNMFTSYLIEDQKINPDTKLLTPNQDTIKISDILTYNPKLFFIYSNANCKSCVESVMSELNKTFSKNESNNVVIIIDSYNIRDLVLLTRKSRINFAIYALTSDATNKSLPRDFPYFALIDYNLMLNTVYIPIAGDINRIQKYLKIAQSKIKPFN